MSEFRKANNRFAQIRILQCRDIIYSYLWWCLHACLSAWYFRLGCSRILACSIRSEKEAPSGEQSPHFFRLDSHQVNFPLSGVPCKLLPHFSVGFRVTANVFAAESQWYIARNAFYSDVLAVSLEWGSLPSTSIVCLAHLTCCSSLEVCFNW